jgi:hypothetical protein
MEISARTSSANDPSTPDPSEFDGGQPQTIDPEGGDLLLPDILRGPASERATLPDADEGDALAQSADAAGPDDDEDERRA